jgi:hypothetical protein
MIHRVEITDEMLSRANARDNGAYNEMSFLGGGGNITGFLGEYMVESVCKNLKLVDKFDHDFELGEITIDVKTKHQKVSYEPKGDYEGSVTVESLEFQHPDYYVFCRVYKDGNTYKHGWVLGGISYSKLMRDGRRVMKGDADGNFTFKKDNINIRYDQLRHIGNKGGYSK